MSIKTRAEVFIQPKNSRPLKTAGQLHYGSNKELRNQVKAYAATVWISAKRIDVDTNSLEIIVDGSPVANYRLHFPNNPVPAEPVWPTKPATARRISTRARHTTTHLALIAAGLLLITTAAGTLNGAWILGVIIAGYGIYRMALGVQRTEARRSPAAAADVEAVTIDELLRGAA